jgi:hypothetical protein
MRKTLNKAASRSGRKLLGAAVISAAALAPMLGASLRSDAAPSNRAPAWGYRNNANRRVYRTIEGVVTSDRRGNDFVVRTNRNERIWVHLNEREPRRLSDGDKVRVYGYLQGGVFQGTSLVILNNRGPNNNNYRQGTFTGVVTSVTNNRRFRLNAEGRTFDVNTAMTLPRALNAGDRVRVSGRWNGNVLTGAYVVLLSNSGGQGNRVNFSGTVLNTNTNSDTIWVRRDNGVTLTVQARHNDARRFERGDHIRVSGHYERGTVYADDIDKL